MTDFYFHNRRQFVRPEDMGRLFIALLCLFFASPLHAREDDRVLYENIVERVEAGEGYYDAAADELRKGGYPLKPTPAFRPPTLAVALGLLPGTLPRLGLLILLCLAAVFAWMRTLKDAPAWERIATITLLMCGLANVGAPNSLYLHEAWAICFIALSLAFYRNLALCLGFALIAVTIRETAILFPIAMGIIALVERDWKRAAWLVVLGLFSAALWFAHGLAASAVLLPNDPPSPGWLAMGGAPMVLAASKWNILTSQLEGVWLALAFLLFAASLATVRRIELRIGAVYVALFSIALLVFGRADNDYWGIMFAPFLAVGLPPAMQAAVRWWQTRQSTMSG